MERLFKLACKAIEALEDDKALFVRGHRVVDIRISGAKGGGMIYRFEHDLILWPDGRFEPTLSDWSELEVQL
ncbi:hypothetical protein [Ktedonospora formicarum]|uniref:Uncharacterized protein n=1 Tax=Ktedonospora formicarum TaxID=2778364 RepID=A0A8J3I2S0_9CHLR|nr:hypothetical protein [Ktedonospora formicarum]GHO45172.1 hypothetical protein KSX_33350 [Ktedonospora formicarum]